MANIVAQAMSNDDYYVNVSMFPTVPMRRAEIRISINANHTLQEIDRLTELLAHHIPSPSRKRASRSRRSTPSSPAPSSVAPSKPRRPGAGLLG